MSIQNIAQRFLALAQQDILLYTFVPKKAITHIRDKGLLSPVELIKDKKALSIARPGETKEYTERVEERMDDPEWKDYQQGVSAFFTLPDFQLLDKNHNIYKFDLLPIRINISQLLKDQPKTVVQGVELAPFKGTGTREKKLSIKQVEKYTLMSPKELWKHYDNPGNKLYAPDVPHVVITTPSHKIAPKYIVS